MTAPFLKQKFKNPTNSRQKITTGNCCWFLNVTFCMVTLSLLGERQIRNYQAEQPDANAWRLILLAAGR